MNVLVNENSLQDIADAIREKNGTEATYKPSEMGEAIRGITDFTNYADSFDFRNFKSEELNIYSENAKSYSIGVVMSGNADGFLKSNKFIKKCVAIFPKATFARHAFNGCTEIIYIKVDFSSMLDSGAVTAYNNTFSNCPKLETIDAIIDGTNCSFEDGTFSYCNNLKNVRFVPLSIKSNTSFMHSASLSDESIQSIIEGLADLTGQATKTLTLHADVKAKLTEEQIATITSKNWTLA